MTSNTKPSQTLSSPPSNCSELQTESDKTANKALTETTFSANKGGLKTTIIANETANIIFKLQTRVLKPHSLQISCNILRLMLSGLVTT